MSESTEEQKEVALSSTLRLLQKSRERMQNNNGTKTRKLRASAGAGSHLLKRERCAGSVRSHFALEIFRNKNGFRQPAV